MECIICCESMFHLYHEPMSMGCKCQERLCQRCFKLGDVTKCPTCRKFKKQPKVDRKLLRKEWKQGHLAKCPGCEKEMYARYLHRHETRCPKYRDVIQGLLEEDLRVRRVQNDRTEQTMAEMETRLDIQADTIDELEDQVEALERTSKRQEDERQLYVLEHGRLLRSLEAFMGPVFANMRSLEDIYSRMSQAACSLRASRAHHQVLRRQLHMRSTSLPPAAALPVVGVPPFQSPPRLVIPRPSPSMAAAEEEEEGEVLEVGSIGSSSAEGSESGMPCH
jgi:uncharacterized coiled-coil protein SlyX